MVLEQQVLSLCVSDQVMLSEESQDQKQFLDLLLVRQLVCLSRTHFCCLNKLTYDIAAKFLFMFHQLFELLVQLVT